MEVRLLGPLEVADDRGPVALGGHRQRAVLARLLVDEGRVVSLDALVEDVWAGVPPGTATKTLQKYVSELRKAVGAEVLVTRGSGYAVRLPSGSVDAHRFESLAAAAHRARDGGDLERAASLLADGLALWRGEVLADVDDAAWVVPARTRLTELRLAALEERLDTLLALGRVGEVAAEAAPLIELHPLREGLRRLSMLALAAAGRPAEALRAYERYRRYLADELGLEPSAELRRLEQAVLTGDSPLGATRPGASHGPVGRPLGSVGQQPGPVGPPLGPPTNLPASPASFVGRQELLESLPAVLRNARLLTLTGPGGAGKTRLAVELARRMLPSHPGGTWLVELAMLSDPALVPGAVADVVGVGAGEQSDRPVLDVLAAALAHRPPSLVVLDNCEHVLDAAAALADGLLRQSPTLRLLATSRTVLGVGGEWVREVPPLAVTPAGSAPRMARESEAVQLFAARARQVVGEVAWTDEEVATAAAICRRLDGLPLAIELAAGQLRVLPLTELDRRLEDPFELLRRTRGRADRHATLLTTVEWSHRRLSPSAQALFAHCSAFAGSFGVDAAAAVGRDVAAAGDVVAVLAELVDSSMLVPEPAVVGEARFRLLETLRVFGRRQLDASGRLDQVLEAAAAFYLGFGRAAGAGLTGPDEARWLVRLRAEAPNLRLVLAWSRGHDPELGVQLGVALVDYWLTPGAWPEGRTHFCALVEEPWSGAPAVRAWALSGAAYLLADAGEARQAAAWAEEALDLFAAVGDGRGEAFARMALGSALRGRGWLDRAQVCVEGALEVWRHRGEPVLEARCLSLLGTIANLRGDYSGADAHLRAGLARWVHLGGASGQAQLCWQLGVMALNRGDGSAARAHCRRALDLYDSVDDQLSMAHVEMAIGDVDRSQGNLDRAGETYARVLRTFQQVDDRRCAASSNKNLAMVAYLGGDRLAARRHYLDALLARHDLGDDGGAAECLEGLSELAADEGRDQRAVVLLAAAFSVRQRTGVRSPAGEQRGVADRVAAIRRRLGPDAFVRAWARGWTLDTAGAVQLGLRPLDTDEG